MSVFDFDQMRERAQKAERGLELYRAMNRKDVRELERLRRGNQLLRDAAAVGLVHAEESRMDTPADEQTRRKVVETIKVNLRLAEQSEKQR